VRCKSSQCGIFGEINFYFPAAVEIWCCQCAVATKFAFARGSRSETHISNLELCARAASFEPLLQILATEAFHEMENALKAAKCAVFIGILRYVFFCVFANLFAFAEFIPDGFPRGKFLI